MPSPPYQILRTDAADERGANEMTAGDREPQTEGKPYGRALWPPETKAKLFAFVKETTAVVKATTGILERVGSVKSDATIALYRRLWPRSGHGEGRGASHGRRDGPELAHDSGGGALPARRRVQAVARRHRSDARSGGGGRCGEEGAACRARLSPGLGNDETRARKSRVGRSGQRCPVCGGSAWPSMPRPRGNVPLWLLCGPPDAGPQRSSAGSRSGVMVMPWSSKYRARRSRQTRGNRSAGSPSIRPPKWADHRDDAG